MALLLSVCVAAASCGGTAGPSADAIGACLEEQSFSVLVREHEFLKYDEVEARVADEPISVQVWDDVEDAAGQQEEVEFYGHEQVEREGRAVATWSMSANLDPSIVSLIRACLRPNSS